MLKPTIKECGTTTRERYLAKLAEDAFFGLWSYPNVYTDEGLTKNKVGKELCDLLVVVNKTVIIFSDKDIKFNSSKEIDIAWKRWFKKSITKSSAQLYGAETWIKRWPERVYLDINCEQAFPIDLSEIQGVHLIAVTCNTSEEIVKHFGGQSGSLVQQFFLNEQESLDKPFHIGDLYPNKSFVHVFDEFTLDILMKELDAITDFIHYLNSKVAIVRQKELIAATGEEEILASYLTNRTKESLLGSLSHPTGNINDGAMLLTEGLWEEYQEGVIYQKSQELFQKYSFIDKVINQFSEHIIKGTVGLGQDLPFSVHEAAVRHLAIEPRLSRSVLSMAFQDKFSEVPSNKRSSRLTFSPFYKDKAYIFLFIPRDKGQPYEEYREQRRNYNEAYAFVAKAKYPEIKTFIVLSTEPQNSDGRSEDIYSVEYEQKFGPTEISKAKELSKTERIMNDTWATRANLLDGVRRNQSQVRNMIPKYGRNEPCLCGSGKKYKKCCI